MSTAPSVVSRFTYADYMTWQDDERWELIDGVRYAMPAASSLHQLVLFELSGQLWNMLFGKPCKGFVAPTEVRFSDTNADDRDVETVVQPDLLVVCDKKKIDRRGVAGAPDFIMEIISPGTSKRDEIIKADLYERHGVKEYWVLYAVEKLIHIRTLGAGIKFESRHVEAAGKVGIGILEALEFDFDLLYEQLGSAPGFDD